MQKAIVEVKNLTKEFGRLRAVNNISFEVFEGEILGLLGPNGAGKTTTILMLLGVVTPTAGEISIFGKDLNQYRSEILKQANFTSAEIDLPWRLTAWENLVVFAKLYEVKDYQERIEKLLDQFQIKEFKNARTGGLSSGELTRLYLCKAFINNPKLLFLDEPTASLDPDIADLTRKYIKKVQKQQNITMLFTSHNMAEVEELCDRVIFLDRGKIIAEDTPLGLARKIKLCRIKLLFPTERTRVQKLLKNYDYYFWFEDKYLVIQLDEERIGQLLGRLSLAKLKYSQITIEKPTLQDYFLKFARKTRND